MAHSSDSCLVSSKNVDYGQKMYPRYTSKVFEIFLLADITNAFALNKQLYS